MTSSPAVVFFGTEHFSAPSLLALIDAGYDIKYVVTKPDSPRGRGKAIESPEVKKIAIEHDIPVMQPVTLTDITDRLAALEQPLGVLVAYGKIIPQSIIDIFSPGIINVHPSLLPKYRGPSPIEAAIRAGDTETGISVMQLNVKMDAGPIYTQVPLPLNGTERKPELYESCSDKGAKLLVNALPDIINGKLIPSPQDEASASYCSLLRKSDGLMDPEHKTATMLEREVRAYLGFPKSRLTYRQTELIVTATHVVDGSDSAPLVIACHDQSYLSIDELIAPSGKKMNAEAFIRGYS